MALTSIAACATPATPSDPGCPRAVAYDQASRNALADELAHLPAGSVIPSFIADYLVLRAQARACRTAFEP